MRNNLLVMATAAVSFVMLAGCSKEPLNNMTEEESRIYITNYDSTVNFSSYKTFSIADSIAIIDNGSLAEKSHTSLDIQFIDAVKKVMQQRGYTLVSKDQDPDFGINLSQINNTQTGIITYPGYWDNYGGYWDPYYWGYGGYSYYGSYAGYYSVTEVALSMDMFDLKNAAGTGKLKSVWSGVIRGEGIFKSSNVSSQVNTLFDQSPYITTAQ